ncbi:TRAP transporter substrate-binding protein [Pseudotabrizicola alkalilacus]|uniref:TRAP transporter substrate-binding protein n=1 Tax=Pseudotabrizicola alkalilacus TaxID=2305252 RepID=A0A411YW94_9RHOB|nr:TRAP transporter substrate-binding protein [Pseudotabrizicola alkalilacus]RGP35151.1 TRAP transporter substrate-binding protein [Pseudotabrizicola alkalilacus]
MKLNRRNFLSATAAATSVMAAPTVLRAQGALVLRMGHPHPETDSWQDTALWMAETLEEKSGGEVTLQVFPNGLIGNDPTMINSVRAGSLDIMVTGNPFFTSLAKELNVLDLPYLFQDRDHVSRVLDGEIGDRLRTGFEGTGLFALSVWETGWRHVTNSRRPVTTPEDIRGLKIRTTPNPAHIEAFRLLGAVPTPMAFTELFTALEMGAVDGQENPTTLILNSRFYEAQKYLSLTQHAFTAAPLVTNAAKLEDMGDDLRALLIETAQEGAKRQRAINVEREATSLASLKDAGMQVVEEPDREAFGSFVSDQVQTTFAAEFGSELIDQINGAA